MQKKNNYFASTKTIVFPSLSSTESEPCTDFFPPPVTVILHQQLPSENRVVLVAALGFTLELADAKFKLVVSVNTKSKDLIMMTFTSDKVFLPTFKA
jgi:hypothetical protein